MSKPRTLKMGAVAIAVLAALSAAGEQVRLDVAMGSSRMLAGEKQTAYLRVAMTGFELEDEGERPPVNVAIVIDRSGSMTGEKIEHAKDAAILALDRLSSRDIVSVVAYCSTVEVLVPATRLTERESVYAAIRRLEAAGSTALFGGVSKGAAEVRKFLERERVNRVILLSDGLANRGPSSPEDLAELGTSLGRDGIAVTTIGLGLDYNEDLMTALARESDGNHMFAEEAGDLGRAFQREFGDVLAVVAQDVDVTIECAEGIRPVRVLGRKADIAGQRVRTALNQLYSGQTKYVILEVEVPAGELGAEQRVAQAAVAYMNVVTNRKDALRRAVAVRFTDSRADVEASINNAVMASVAQQLGAETNRWAMKLRDEGNVAEARRVLFDNAEFLHESAAQLGAAWLDNDADANRLDAGNLDGEAWGRQRKVMQFNQFQIENQGQAAQVE
ncbi:MAG: VWA domain-containing protein [Candidatus Hydrogenedentes bacterium]|nr:VWA domain-containing protein [Candidatus Hydrogenedentota bacterium]